jgi:hypothetical protein
MVNLLEQIAGFITNHETAFPGSDAEQKEVILDNYCSMIQPLLVSVVTQQISDE